MSPSMSPIDLDMVCDEYEQRWEASIDEGDTYYLPEKYQLGVLLYYFRHHEFHYATEARVLDVPLDILAAKRGTTLAIELKSGNSKRGFVQAQRNATLVDYSFLSVWADNVTDHLTQRVAGTSVGLISVSDRVTFLSPPEQKDKTLCTPRYIHDILNEAV